MFGKKTHGIRPIEPRQKKVHLKAECENCGRFDVVSVYEDHVEKPEFKLEFYECAQCKRTFCAMCGGDQKRIVCPFCKKLKPKRLRPFDLYVCGICFSEWWKEGGFCRECKYVPQGAAKKDDHYPGPPL